MATTSKKTTAKSSASKKPATKSAAVSKKPAVKKAVVRKPAAKATVKHAAKTAKKGHYQSFKVMRNDPAEFSSMRITRQTIYWIILVSFIIFAQLWIIKLQIDVATLIDAQQAQLQGY